MVRRSVKLVLTAIVLAAVGGGVWWWYESQKACCGLPPEASAPPLPLAAAEPQPMGLMTSLPLYWPVGADMAAIASGEAETPWQRAALEVRAIITPLDTLSPVPSLGPDGAEVDPLAGLQRLAIIQPRGLSPADNVALDDWVRRGGSLLLVLDPLLTGEYSAPLGDPRRPTDMALIPPVVGRWGLQIAFDEAQEPLRSARIGGNAIALSFAGAISTTQGDGACIILAEGVAAQCDVGEGRVTLIADAALFEHPELAGANGESIQALMDFAFE